MAARPQRKRDTHIYLTEKEYAALAKEAERQSRTITAQVTYFVRRGLENAERPQ